MNNSEKTLQSMAEVSWYNRWLIGRIGQYLHGDILEVGCGIGNFTKELSPDKSIWAIDIDKEYIEKTRSLVDGQAKIGYGDIEKGQYFFKSKKFNSIVCLNVLEHIKDDEHALDNLTNLLKPGGFLILVVPSHPLLYGEIDRSIGHYRRYDKKSLTHKLEAKGLRIIVSKKINLFGALGWWFAGKILKNKSVEMGKIKIFNTISPIVLRIEELIEPPLGISILIVAQKQ